MAVMIKNVDDVIHVKTEQVSSSNVKFRRNKEFNKGQEYKFKSIVEVEPFDNLLKTMLLKK